MAGTCWSSPASSWRPSWSFAPTSRSGSTSRKTIWTATIPSKTTPPPRAASLKLNAPATTPSSMPTMPCARPTRAAPPLRRSGSAAAALKAAVAGCASSAGRPAATPQWFSSRRELESGAEPGATLAGDRLMLDGQLLMAAGEIPIRGRHNVENVLAASIAAARAGVPHAAIAAAVRSFRAVEHRLEFVRSVSGVEFYNDSKATSVDATLKALDAFPGGLWVILGGKDKGLEYTALRQPLAAKAHAALLIGAAAPKIADQLQGAVPLVPAKTIEAALAYAYAHAVPGDTVLLAPACASFDQFQSYEHRGQFFKQIVNQLTAKE